MYDLDGGTTWGANAVDFENESYVGTELYTMMNSQLQQEDLYQNGIHIKEIKDYILWHQVPMEQQFQTTIG